MAYETVPTIISSWEKYFVYDSTYRNLETIFLGTELSKKTWNKKGKQLLMN